MSDLLSTFKAFSKLCFLLEDSVDKRNSITCTYCNGFWLLRIGDGMAPFALAMFLEGG